MGGGRGEENGGVEFAGRFSSVERVLGLMCMLS